MTDYDDGEWARIRYTPEPPERARPFGPYRWRKREKATQALAVAGVVWLVRRFR